jgi:hypothetical protein
MFNMRNRVAGWVQPSILTDRTLQGGDPHLSGALVTFGRAKRLDAAPVPAAKPLGPADSVPGLREALERQLAYFANRAAYADDAEFLELRGLMGAIKLLLGEK